MHPTRRPIPLIVVCVMVLIWSALAVLASATRLARVVDAETVYLLVQALVKAGLVVAMWRRVAVARLLFLAFFLLDTILIGPFFQWSQIVDNTLLGAYIIQLFMFVVYAVLLFLPPVSEYFGAGPIEGVLGAVRDWGVRHRPAFTRFGARVLLAVSVVIVAGFVVRAVLDLYAVIAYRPAEAEIVAADVRDADVKTTYVRDPHSSSSQPRPTTTIVTHEPKITFRYVVDGRTYERTGFTTFGSTLSATFSPATVRDKYEVGTKQTCFYDPFDPSRAVLEFGVSPYYAFAFFALILLAIARVIAAHVLSRG